MRPCVAAPTAPGSRRGAHSPTTAATGRSAISRSKRASHSGKRAPSPSAAGHSFSGRGRRAGGGAVVEPAPVVRHPARDGVGAAQVRQRLGHHRPVVGQAERTVLGRRAGEDGQGVVEGLRDLCLHRPSMSAQCAGPRGGDVGGFSWNSQRTCLQCARKRPAPSPPRWCRRATRGSRGRPPPGWGSPRHPGRRPLRSGLDERRSDGDDAAPARHEDHRVLGPGPGRHHHGPGRPRRRRDQGRAARRRLHPRNDVAHRRGHLAHAPAPQPGQALPRARPAHRRRRRHPEGAGHRRRRRRRGHAAGRSGPARRRVRRPAGPQPQDRLLHASRATA